MNLRKTLAGTQWMMRSFIQMKSSRSLSMREKLRCPKVMVPTQTFLPCHLWVMGIQEGCLHRDTLLILTLLLDPPCQGLTAMEFPCMGLFQASQLILNNDLVNNHLNNKGANHCLKVDNSSNNREV